MQNTIRTTVRIRSDLFDQFRFLALKKGTSLQEIINNTLALGLGKISDLDSDRKAMNKINRFRASLVDKDISLEELLNTSKFDLK
ncbi:MAG TPA: hypothetical protein VMR41_03320 [Patescibacteria group bacterium]|nr:hypothetical protein [Patescibacteria group bacterium]